MPAVATRRMSKPKAKTKPSSPETPAAPSSPEAMAAAQTRLEKKTKISAASLRALFEFKEGDAVEPVAGAKPTPLQKLKALIRDRVKDGRRLSLKDWRVYHAIDLAYNAPFHQITPTLIGKILAGDRRLKPEEIIKELETLGLSESTLFTEIQHPTKPTEKIKVLNRETFHKILVPIVKSVINARESKLFDDRNNNPFLSYSPQRQNEEYKAVGDIVTNLVEGITTAYGLKAVVRAAIHQSLKYSFALAVPAEAWHYEKDITEDGEEYTRKEGIRYNIPHPTRCAIDPNYRPSTINTDTGCEWYEYWNLNRFGSIDSNPEFYNKERISYGQCWFGGDNDYYFKHVYPCTMEHPIPVQEWSNTREKDATIYTSNDYDKAVFKTDLFMKLIPAQWGLGDYKYNLWFRFVVANDDVVIYAQPLPYSPGLYMGSDADDSTSSKCAGLGLEAIPWQDLVGNVLSQHLLAVKQNCTKVITFDKTQLTEAKIREIEARSKESQNIVWIPINPREQRVGQQETQDMLNVLKLPYTDTAPIINTISQVFNIMERALGMSAQEVGSIAGHIQTAEEVRTTSQNTSARLDYIGTFVDEFLDAMKRQIYVGFQNFGDEEFVVQVNGVEQEMADKLNKKYGFSFEKTGKDIHTVTGNASKLSVDAFISSREGKTRLNQPQIAQTLMQTIQILGANQDLAGRLGPEWFAKQIDRITKLAGGPEDFEVKLSPEATTVVEMKKLMESLQQYSKQITDAATQQATAGATQAITSQVAPVIQKTEQEIEGAKQTADQAGEMGVELHKKIEGIEKTLAQLIKLATQAPPEPPQDIPVNGPVNPPILPFTPAAPPPVMM